MSTVRVSEDSGASFSQKAGYTYDVNDNLIKATYGNRLSDNYTYNLNNLVSDMSIKSSSGPTLRSMLYVYNRAGNMTEKNENISGKITNVTYDYDNTNRLISEAATGVDNYRYAYGYDSSGNRTSLDFYRDDVLKYNETYSYDKNNRLILSSRTDKKYKSSTRYKYDANGNQTIVERYKDNADGILKLNTEGPEDGYDFIANLEYFTYNGFNQLTDYKTYGNTNMKEDLTFSSYKTVKYTYYADGLRASKAVSLDDKVMYLWNGDNIYAETTDIRNAPGERYYRGHQLICDNSNNYYMHNAHGDVVFIHNGAAELNSYTYDAFGNSDSQMKFGYCEQQYDAETGLYYLRARYYNSAIGRFITEDPIKDGHNWYAYCDNNSVKYYDLTGYSRTNQVWSYRSDAPGRAILYHYLFGNGEEMVKENDYLWNKYMKDNEILTEKTKAYVFSLSEGMENNSQKNVNESISMEIENGEDIIGYQYLHGTNADVGDFSIEGTISKDGDGNITYEFTYTWNDIIDPNPEYASDMAKAEFAKKIPLANPKDYIIRISWSDKTVIKNSSSFLNGNSGWLK